MDAYDIAEKIKKYWGVVHPKYSGELNKPKVKVKVIVHTADGYREVVGVYIKDDTSIELKLDGE